MEVSTLFKKADPKLKALYALIALAGTGALGYSLYLLILKLFKEPDNNQDNNYLHDDKMEQRRSQDKALCGLLAVFDYEVEDTYKTYREVGLPKYYQAVGLPNIGNTCYMNSLLQILAGSNTFMSYVRKLMNTITVVPDNTNSLITFRLLELLLNLNKGSVETTPYDLYQLLCHSEFTEHSEQQDSHELLAYLQENITKVTAKHLRENYTDPGLSLSSEEWMSDSTTHSSAQREVDNSIEEEIKLPQIVQKLEFCQPSYLDFLTSGRHVKGLLKIKDLEVTKRIGINPFAGVYLSTITCLKCGKEEELHRWEVAYDLSLEVRSTLEMSLNNYFKGEQIEDYTCIKCSLREFLKGFPKNVEQIGDLDTRNALIFLYKLKNTHDLDEESFVKEWKSFKLETKNTCRLQIDKLQTQIIKKFSVVTPPKILCVHFKRVFYNQFGQMSLNRDFIRFPEYLDLSKIDQMRANGYSLDIKYKLSGVIEHFGSAHSGHYVAFRPLFTNESNKVAERWVLCDDSETTILRKEDVLARKAYMLLYERI